jgi:cbb3-type cytochrome oxidase subunit 3
MRMTDLVSGLDMTMFPTIGLVIFGLIFLAVTVRVLRSPKSDAVHHAALPLEEGATPNAREASDVR